METQPSPLPRPASPFSPQLNRTRSAGSKAPFWGGPGSAVGGSPDPSSRSLVGIPEGPRDMKSIHPPPHPKPSPAFGLGSNPAEHLRNVGEPHSLRLEHPGEALLWGVRFGVLPRSLTGTIGHPFCSREVTERHTALRQLILQRTPFWAVRKGTALPKGGSGGEEILILCWEGKAELPTHSGSDD